MNWDSTAKPRFARILSAPNDGTKDHGDCGDRGDRGDRGPEMTPEPDSWSVEALNRWLFFLWFSKRRSMYSMLSFFAWRQERTRHFGAAGVSLCYLVKRCEKPVETDIVALKSAWFSHKIETSNTHNMEVSWNRATPSHHPYFHGIFPNKNHPALGVAPLLEAPITIIQLSWGVLYHPYLIPVRDHQRNHHG